MRGPQKAGRLLPGPDPTYLLGIFWNLGFCSRAPLIAVGLYGLRGRSLQRRFAGVAAVRYTRLGQSRLEFGRLGPQHPRQQ